MGIRYHENIEGSGLNTLMPGGLVMRLLALGFYLALAVTGANAAETAAIRHGESLLAKDCARCHATGRTGESRHPEAPLSRHLGRRYPIESLEEALGEGIISGHPDMPEFRFKGDDVGAIIAYLKSIQER